MLRTWKRLAAIAAFATGVATLASCGGGAARAPYAWFDAEPHASGLWLTGAVRDMYRDAPADVLALRRLSTADSTVVEGAGDALGYGVSCLADGTLVVAHYARACHWGCDEKYPAGTSRCIVRHSDDGGQTWSAPLRLDEALPCQDSATAGNGWGLAMCYANDTVYLASARGFYVSADRARTWHCVASGFALGSPGFDGAGKVHIGPQLIHTERSGLLAFGQDDDIRAGEMLVLHSLDGGRTWARTVVATGRADVTPYEPTAVRFAPDSLLFFTRNGPNGQGANPAQFTLVVEGPGRYRVVDPQVTNCTVTGHQDTHDVIYNPVTDQFEATVSDRCATAHDYSIMSVALWTIPRRALLAGSAEWRKVGYFFPPMTEGRDAEGSHPGGSCIDLARGKQYLQVHRGVGHAVSSSLYHLERTLETDRLEGVLVR